MGLVRCVLKKLNQQKKSVQQYANQDVSSGFRFYGSMYSQEGLKHFNFSHCVGVMLQGTICHTSIWERFRIWPLMAVTVRWTLVALATCATLSHSENDWQLCLNGTDANCCSSECYVSSFSTKVTYY